MNRAALDGLSWRMSEVYAACVDQLLVNLARHFAYIKDGAEIPGSWGYTVRKLAEMDAVTQESEAIILSMLGDADGSLKYILEEAVREGLKDADPALKKAAENGLIAGPATPDIAPHQMQAFQAYYRQSADKLNLVNTVMLESTQNAYAATVADIAGKISETQGILNTATGKIVSGVDTFNRAQRDAVRRMVDNGLTGFIDHGGHHWSPEAYVAMDMRTTMTNTARAAVSEQMETYGCELYQVSWHDGARPLCYPWQGKVISTNGWTGEVEDGEGNKVQVHSEAEIESFRYGGGLFGVNCGHYQIPFFPGFSRSRPPRQDEAANKKEYAESQEQRRLERKVREEKRELDVMKAQGATPAEIAAQKERIREANANLNDFCKQTGRARQSGRTSTPINATFPDGYKQTKWEQGIKRRDPTKPAATPAKPAANQPAAKPAGQIKPRSERIAEYEAPIKKYQDEIDAIRKEQHKFWNDHVGESGEKWFKAEDKKFEDRIKAIGEKQMKLKDERDALRFVENLPNTGIAERPLTRWDHTPTTEEIIATLGGPDRTKGSCASLTLAYAGNRGGYDVLDFRDGQSRFTFSATYNLDKIAALPGLEGVVIKNYNDFDTAHQMMRRMVEGKEYFFGVANHAAVVRKTATGYEYLELQGSAARNGFKALDDGVLKLRFGCQKRHTSYGSRYKVAGELIPIETMKSNPDFLDVLKFINTAADQQRKGLGGGLR